MAPPKKQKPAEPKIEEEVEAPPEPDPKAKPVDGTYYCANSVVCQGKHYRRGEEHFFTAAQVAPIMASVALVEAGRPGAAQAASITG